MNKTLKDFVDYCLLHPEQRFWQALVNWSKSHCIYKVDVNGIQSDTFYFKGKEI